MRLTLAQRLQKRMVHLPNPFLYSLLYYFVVKPIAAKLHTHFIYKAKPSEEKGSFVLVSNHATRMDYAFTAPAVFPKRLNYVVGYNEFFVFPTVLLLKWLQVIPKRNFVPDPYTITSIRRIVNKGGNICFMPNGMSSITGLQQPVMPGTGKLLRMLRLPVYYTKINGGYLSNTKHCLDQRPGRVDVVVDKMFSPEQLASMKPQEIEDQMNRLLAQDDYLWNEKEQVHYKNRNNLAYGLDTLLYQCPKCGKVADWTTEGNTMTCNACGNKIEMDDTYAIHPVGPDSVCPPKVSDWVIMQREKAMEDVKDPDFCFSEHVRLGILPDYRYVPVTRSSDIAGDGIMTLKPDGLHFDGTLKDKPFSFFIPIEKMPTFGMVTDITHLATYIDDVFYEFYPDSRDALRWDFLLEEMHRHQGGVWQASPYRHTDENLKTTFYPDAQSTN